MSSDLEPVSNQHTCNIFLSQTDRCKIWKYVINKHDKSKGLDGIEQRILQSVLVMHRIFFKIKIEKLIQSISTLHT